MRRRDVLAALASGAAVLAGCSTRSRPVSEATPEPEPTPPPDVTTITETKSLPAPDGPSSRLRPPGNGYDRSLSIRHA
jgi:PBP1b-binding outer membrane lipoprotein LpoB